MPPGDVSPLVQDRFAYARSMDMCTWDELDPVLATRTPGAWDEQAIWAPYVFLDGITYYMYYTGVTSTGTQSIMLATTTSPSNPASWQPQGMVFQPDHEGFVWEDGKWADCRDPTVVKYEEKYYLYYTGSDVTGGIIGMAVSSDLKGPWIDQGGIVSPEPEAMLESPTIVRHGEYYYLIYNLASVGGYYRIGNNLDGPWQNPDEFRPGWAHEVWQNMADDWYTSYLTDYTVTISPLTWDDFFDPPRLVVGGTVFHEFLPLILFNSDSNAK
ncbi:MAG: family 43 glycosylhydrolase [Chloroflexi bacterium]|nr:family 43 glycosylhydrolase [Chloroflexota bacterium]